MDEHEWLTSTDPAAMVEWMRSGYTLHVLGTRPHPMTDRKMRLFACAVCRAVWDSLTDPRSRRAVEVAEAFADGVATGKERGLAMNTADLIPGGWMQERSWAYAVLRADASQAAWEVTQLGGSEELTAAQARILRCVVGNPFRPVSLCGTCVGGRRFDAPCADCGLIRCWNDGAPVRLARAAYADRDWGLLPYLADALEEAGCTNANILAHLRGPGPHARGDWALDLLLGKE